MLLYDGLRWPHTSNPSLSSLSQQVLNLSSSSNIGASKTYRTLQDVLTQTSGTANMTIYTSQRLGVRIDMTDRWASNVFCSNGWSMACFGLFILARGSWNMT